MQRFWIPKAALMCICCLPIAATAAQQDGSQPFTIPVRVNEVNVDFSASDQAGVEREDLKASDLRVLDNGKPQKVLAFRHRTGLPIAAGILVDTSRSMLFEMVRNRRIVDMLAQHVLRTNSDKAFVMQFDFEAKMMQPWTSDKTLLNAGMAGAGQYWQSRLGGTAIFDSIYRACRDQFGTNGIDQRGNFILLFSDGLDNRSHALLSDVIERCQESHVSIFPFSGDLKASRDAGQRVLSDLAAKTGGRVFYDQDEEGELRDLREIEKQVRNQYQVAYRPTRFKPDGSFHKIRIETPGKDLLVRVRDGYYAR